MNITDHQGMFCNGKAAAFTRGIDTYSGIAAQLAAGVPDPEIAAHLRHLCALNRKIAHAKPETFEEACQFLLWYQMACRSYNGSGSLGRLDALLYPYYARETAAGTLDDERAVFLIACLLLRDTAYVHLGGYNRDGSDATNPVSYLVLEAVHRLKLPSNVGVCVGKGLGTATCCASPWSTSSRTRTGTRALWAWRRSCAAWSATRACPSRARACARIPAATGWPSPGANTP